MPSQPQLEVLVLGPLAVRLNGVPLAVDRPLERALLVRLALAGGLPVPDQRLAVDLWGDVDLARPTERLRVLASRLRAALGTPDVLTRASNGYALSAEMTDLTAARSLAKNLYAAARAGDHAAVSALGREALGLWRGASLADLRTVPYAATEAEQLDSWRLDLQVERLEADLALGGATEAGRELESLAAEHPLHERLWCLLALALYRTGRQADALARLAQLRGRLASELGVDPASGTSEMELRLLRQDPGLLLPESDSDLGELSGRGESGTPPPPQAPDWLPLPMTTFVGRQATLADLIRQLGRPGLVTLTGSAGSGKSRLAFEAVRAVAATGRPVRLVPLRAITSAELDPLADGLDDHVLVLDDAEHLLEPVAKAVSGLLARTTLTVLVTSREPLRLDEEETQQLEPLDAFAAARLFTERCAADAQQADPDLVAAICTAAGGMPLGIELAAGLTRTVPVGEVAAYMRERNGLHAVLDRSLQLLDTVEREVLLLVASFADGFTLEAAEQAAADPRDVAPALTELADRNLLLVEAVGGRRFRMPGAVRDHLPSR
ncbi:BTAD domain-containing putative transcriptional regulator [Kribbella sp. NPDC051770]|uniref:AfsR/SARP family transcriptional regulator n=1 Tax=Kribbella sp. NPDC051770 TaxID=3155413 RepID=UPI003424F7F8